MEKRNLLTVFLILMTSVSVSAQTEVRSDAEVGTISGRVVNESGVPLPNVTVSVRSVSNPSQSRATFTDGEGNFRVDGLGQADFSVRAHAPAYIYQTRAEEGRRFVRIGDSVTLTLIKGGVITGRITNANGEALVQVPVRVMLIRYANNMPLMLPFQGPEQMTDDRGVYRLYGLAAGTYVVSAGARNTNRNLLTAYDTDAPTYAPASNRDQAAEITVAAGQEITGVDISYRGEPGCTITGTVLGLSSNQSFSVQLTRLANELPQLHFNQGFRGPNGEFIFSALEEGEYELTAQTNAKPGEMTVSDPIRITVMNADVTDVKLTLKPLASIAGVVKMETSSEPDCKGKPQQSSANIAIMTQKVKFEGREWRRLYYAAQARPDKEGKFYLSGVRAEHYWIDTRLNENHWYVKAVSTSKPVSNIAANGIRLKSGERVGDVTITIAAGAGTLSGRVSEPYDPGGVFVLVPAEKEQQEEVLRYFSMPLGEEGGFAIRNIPPGRYFALVRSSDDVKQLRNPEHKTQRANLYKAATKEMISVELKPCQNIVDYQLPLNSIAAPK